MNRISDIITLLEKFPSDASTGVVNINNEVMTNQDLLSTLALIKFISGDIQISEVGLKNFEEYCSILTMKDFIGLY